MTEKKMGRTALKARDEEPQERSDENATSSPQSGSFKDKSMGSVR